MGLEYSEEEAKKGNYNKTQNYGNLPGGAVIKNPPANAEDRFEPWSVKIPYAAEQLSPYDTTTEPTL